MACVPGPAVAGLNVFPVTPGPLKVPPASVPVKVTEDASAHSESGSPEKETLVMNRIVLEVALQVPFDTLTPTTAVAEVVPSVTAFVPWPEEILQPVPVT